MKYGFLKVAAITPKIKTGNIEYNTKQILSNIAEAHTLAAQIAVFPELSICGKDIGDMAYNPSFLYECETSLRKIADATRQRDITCFVGLPIKIDNNVYNAVACLSRGLVCGISIKTDLSREERRVFSTVEISSDEIEVGGFVSPISNSLIYSCENLNLAVCISATPDFRQYAKNGVNLLIYINSAPYTVETYHDNFIKYASKQFSLGVIEVGGGIFESTAVNMYMPKKAIYECGHTLKFCKDLSTEIIITDIDLQRIEYISSKSNIMSSFSNNLTHVDIKIKKDYEVLDRTFEKQPFVLKNSADYDEMLKILATAIFNRVKHTKAESLVIGVSGGLDSTATLIAVEKFCDIYEFDKENVLCLTMPCFASSPQTYNNAVGLISAFKFTHKNIPINQAVKNHLLEIEHDMTEDITYENAQARERTQVLMDFANMTKGIMLGTSDMSEEALGFSTFGGDQISMLNVLSGVCKTTLRGLVSNYVDNTENLELQVLLSNVLETPISPELKSNQETEKQIGSYELHDFILYNFLANGYSKEKIAYIAEKTFEEYSVGEINDTINIFFNRFFKSQFKRNATSDGVKIFDVSLSAANFMLNSDFDGSMFNK